MFFNYNTPKNAKATVAASHYTKAVKLLITALNRTMRGGGAQACHKHIHVCKAAAACMGASSCGKQTMLEASCNRILACMCLSVCVCVRDGIAFVAHHSTLGTQSTSFCQSRYMATKATTAIIITTQ